MQIKPLRDNVIIKPMPEEQKTASGIVLPDTAEKEKPEQGQVIAVGPGRTTDDGTTIKINIQKGDKVLFTKYAPNEIKVNGEE
ncbi:co-chaperone GroES, partial [bacterium]|nr:co-chaperone GroES [bacterium]